MRTVDILHDKVGSRKEFIKIFSDMCQAADIKHKVITGFIKDDMYNPGDYFDKKKSELESWIVVYIENDWRLVDPVLGAGKSFTFHDGKNSLNVQRKKPFFLFNPVFSR